MTTKSNTARLANTVRTGQFSFLDLARHIGATHRQRQNLGALDAAALNDIGLTRTQADAEATRPIWDVPPNWLR